MRDYCIVYSISWLCKSDADAFEITGLKFRKCLQEAGSQHKKPDSQLYVFGFIIRCCVHKRISQISVNSSFDSTCFVLTAYKPQTIDKALVSS